MQATKVFVQILIFLIGINSAALAQVISAFTPASATPGQTTDVSVRGLNTHFRNGVSVADFGTGITVLKLTVNNSITATATIRVASNAFLGFRNVKITTASEVAELDNSFEIFSQSGSFRANIQLLPMESVSLKDIDLSQPTQTPILFFANVYNDATDRKVNIKVAVSSSSKGLIGTMLLNNQPLSSNAFAKFTNREFTAVKMNGSVGADFLNFVETTGTFPPDDYIYKLTVTDINGSVLATDESQLSITNPLTNPELILPGSSFSNMVPDVYTPFPMFQWFGMNNKYDISIYEYRSGQTQEDVIRNVAVYQQKDVSATSLLYPVFAEKLIDGKIYAWQVIGKVVSGSGTKYLPSEVYRFKYIDISSSGKKIVSRITLSPEEITLYEGQKQQFTAICYDQDGALMNDVTPTWSVSPANGTITPTGLFTAGEGGKTVAVLMTAGTATEFATVTVNAGNAVFNAANPFDGFIKKLFGLQ